MDGKGAESGTFRPPDLDVDTAASVAIAGLTAWYGLHDLAAIKPGMRVLVHAGAGGVGGMAAQIARLGESLPLPQLRLPYLFSTELGPDDVARLAEDLTAGVGRLSEGIRS